VPESLSVSEFFGPTLQGEGPSQGRAAVFLRLGLCNLDCSWCDTPYTWDWAGKNGVAFDRATELKRLPLEQIVASLRSLTDETVRPVLVVTGGEPLVQQTALAALLDLWDDRAEIETNGTIIPNEALVQRSREGLLRWNCSPKLANSGITEDRRINPEALSVLSEHDTAWKFVVSTLDDIAEIENFLASYLPEVPPGNIWLMPEGTTPDILLARIRSFVFDQVARRGWNLSPRLHALVFGDIRGI